MFVYDTNFVKKVNSVQYIEKIAEVIQLFPRVASFILFKRSFWSSEGGLDCILVIEKGNFMHSLSTSTWSHANGYWAWHIILPGDKEPHGLCQAIALYGSIFSCFMLSNCSFGLCQWPEGTLPPFSISDFTGEESESFCYGREELTQASCIASAIRGTSCVASYEEATHIIGANLGLPLLCVSKTVVASSAWIRCVFLGDSNMKVQ